MDFMGSSGCLGSQNAARFAYATFPKKVRIFIQFTYVYSVVVLLLIIVLAESTRAPRKRPFVDEDPKISSTGQDILLFFAAGGLIFSAAILMGSKKIVKGSKKMQQWMDQPDPRDGV
jgi:hypothetical protein